MRGFFEVIGWGLVGSVVAASLTFGAFLACNYREMTTHDTDEVQAWTVFAAMMASAGFAMGGFMLGAICGVIRIRRRRRARPLAPADRPREP